MITTEGIIQPHDTEARRALICFATELGMDDSSLGEASRLDFAGADLSLLNSGRAPLLADHYRSIEAVLGVIESAWMDGERALAIARFADTPRAREAWAMVRDRILGNVSMGFICDTGAQGSDADTPRLIRRWRPYEVSLVAVPANWNACVLPDAPAIPIHAVASAAEARRRGDLQAAMAEVTAGREVGA